MSAAPRKEIPLSILVVDDEPIVVQSLGDWFRQDGHRFQCLMHFSTDVEAADLRPMAFCPVCAAQAAALIST